MYIRVNRTPNSPRKSIQIVESIREGEKVRQRIVHYVGIALDEQEEQKLKDYGVSLIAKLTAQREEQAKQRSLFSVSEKEVLAHLRNKQGRPKKKRLEDILPPSQVCLEDIEEECRIVEGIHEVAGKLYDEMYGSLCKNKRERQRLKDVVLARLLSPISKHRTQKYLKKHFAKSHSLNSIYRMMDEVFLSIDEIKRLTFESTKLLFPEKIDLLFFDVTTLYFESTETDELRNFGYSKDHRFKTTQVVLALATNQDGLPIGYELFEGNRAEVTSLVGAIESWKKLFQIDSICFVGDRAMFTDKNMELLKTNNYHYIIAVKLRKLPRALQEKIFQESYYQPDILKNTFDWVGEFEHKGNRLIVSYKAKRALKDQQERQRLLNKIEKIIGKQGNPNKLITNAGAKKFLTTDKKAVIRLDDNKIQQETQWDGLHGVITTLKDDSAASILARYANLWVIEESFRLNKHTLQMRPIFHWKPQRIHAHIAICYLTFSLVRHLQYRVNLTQKISIDTILEELMSVQASIHRHKKTKDRYRLPGYFTHNARKIYKTFGIQRSLDATVYLD